MTLGWILVASFAGGTLSAGLAAFALFVRASWVPMLVSYAIGALLGAAFLEVIPHAFEKGPPREAAISILAGIFGFFVLEKLGAVTGVSNLHIYAAMRGDTLEAFQRTRNAPGALYSVAGVGAGNLGWDPPSDTAGHR